MTMRTVMRCIDHTNCTLVLEFGGVFAHRQEPMPSVQKQPRWIQNYVTAQKPEHGDLTSLEHHPNDYGPDAQPLIDESRREQAGFSERIAALERYADALDPRLDELRAMTEGAPDHLRDELRSILPELRSVWPVVEEIFEQIFADRAERERVEAFLTRTRRGRRAWARWKERNGA